MGVYLCLFMCIIMGVIMGVFFMGVLFKYYLSNFIFLKEKCYERMCYW